MYNTHQNHQNHQNMRFDLIYCVQKESISPFQLCFPYLKKINKKNSITVTHQNTQFNLFRAFKSHLFLLFSFVF